jgi:AcrR family transcriptional regulator
MVPSTSGVDDEGFRAALVGAAWEMFARRSPSSVSVRVLAEMAGCSHGTITSTFGSRSGLERAVADQVAVTVEEAVVDVLAQPGWPFGAMLRMRHEHPRVTRLFVRLGLGDLPIDDFLSRSTIGDRLVGRIEGFRGGSPRRPTQRSRLAAHGVLCTVLGACTFDIFNIRSVRSAGIDGSVRDAALTNALTLIAELPADDAVELRTVHRRSETAFPSPPRPPDLGRSDVSDALITSVIELFAVRGPSAISIRDIAANAGLQHGLIHRHFGTKEALLNAAIDRLAQVTITGMSRPAGVDVGALVRMQRRSLNPWIIARLMADGVDVTESRRSYPLVDAVLDTFPDVPDGDGPGDLTDPRLAVYAVSSLISGYALWDVPVRRLVGLPTGADVDLDPAVTLMVERLLAVPRRR